MRHFSLRSVGLAAAVAVGAFTMTACTVTKTDTAAAPRADSTTVNARADAALERARAGRRELPRAAAPALFRGMGHVAALKAMATEGRPVAVTASEFSRRCALGRRALTGRWWE